MATDGLNFNFASIVLVLGMNSHEAHLSQSTTQSYDFTIPLNNGELAGLYPCSYYP